jgi:hypothetical protein
MCPEIIHTSDVMVACNTGITKTHVPTHKVVLQTQMGLPCKSEVKVKLEKTEIKNSPFVKGTLKKNLNWWKLHAPKYIVDVVENGYVIPLYEWPLKSSARNNKSALDNAGFVDTSIESLLRSGVIKQCAAEPHVVNPLTVASNLPTKLRLVLDLRLVNPSVSLAKVKFEDIAVASKLFRKNQFLNVFDLTSAYHHIEIHASQQTLLGFRWNELYYCFCCMPFGLKSAGLCCTKVLRVLIKKWRTEAHTVVFYLDD